ncbi:SPS-sensor component SSY1 [Cyberlindnera fabianii]|uniref:SPS-sensor component SSY1 n=1 Tax=Cyberlindnera fabianii TaxID=36022 RepID=A0A1V2KZB6_CYBFA|nr:SPS-sensor component SSY1 [Cyberlindnera fabianii]
MSSGKSTSSSSGRDLFPRMEHPLREVPGSAVQDEDEADACSITSEMIRTKLESLEPRAYTEPTGDKFFYTRLFGREGELAVEDVDDFQQYDAMVHREAILKGKAKHVLTDMQRNDIRVGMPLESQFSPGMELVNGTKRHKFPEIRRPSATRAKELHPKLLRETTRGSNITEVVDISSDNFIDRQEENTLWSEKPTNNYGSGGEKKYHLQRKLARPQIQMIALGGTLGVGLYLSSGKAFSISGPLGCFLGFLISGSIVLATMLSFAEMSTLIPTTSSISGLASRFVEDAFGFALGWCYWLSFTIAMPSEVCAASIMLSYYETFDLSEVTPGFVALFLVLILTINLFDVRVYGNIEYCISLIKVLLSVALIITMIVINVKEGYGFKFWDTKKSQGIFTYGPFRPTFDLSDVGSGALNGIGGATGRLLGVISSMLISSYAYTGSEIGFVASMECKNPRKALPSVTKRVFGRVVFLYLLSIFLVGLNFYAGDPRLLRYYAPERGLDTLDPALVSFFSFECSNASISDYSNGSQSPWIIAMQSSGMCLYSSVINAFFIMFGVTAGSSHLYVSSRTLYSMATQRKAFAIFATCSKAGVPYVSVLFSGAFGLLAFFSVNEHAFSVFQDFANISSATAMLMWSGMCLSFLRFFYGLKLRPDIISRDDPSYPYRSPLQPFLAIYGLCGSMLIVLLMGFVVFLKGYWDTKTFFVSYGALMLFVICYVGYKLVRSSKIHRLDQLDLDSGRREMDRIIWDEEKYYVSSVGEIFKKVISWLA